MSDKIILIRTDGTHSVLDRDPDSLRQLQQLVGGFIEIVRARPQRRWTIALGSKTAQHLVCVVNEEGLLLDLPANGMATWAAAYPGVLAGDAVFMLEGFNDDGEPDLMPFSQDDADKMSLILFLSGSRCTDDGDL